jgi:hypothetical protein
MMTVEASRALQVEADAQALAEAMNERGNETFVPRLASWEDDVVV